MREGRRRREIEWLLLELDPDYVRRVWMPELVRTYLNPGPESLFELEIRVAAASNTVVFSSHPVEGRPRWVPESSSSCFAVEMFRRRGRGPANGAFVDKGRWVLEGRCRSGQLENVVARARWRNLAVAGLVNGLILAAGIMLVRQTRLSRRVAESQMNFVAGVSHELRTPLAVVRSATHNLLKGVVQDPDRIREYVRLIAAQAEQLGEMIEQVLTFSSVYRSTEHVPQESVCLPEVLQQAVGALSGEKRPPDARSNTVWPRISPRSWGTPRRLATGISESHRQCREAWSGGRVDRHFGRKSAIGWAGGGRGANCRQRTGNFWQRASEDFRAFLQG